MTYVAPVYIDSHGFVTLRHPKGWSSGSLDTNAVAIADLEIVIAYMKKTGKGRKPDVRDPRDPWDGIIRLPYGVEVTP